MHCLVQYVDDNILNIVQTKSLSEIDKNAELYWAPYKKMGYYEAKPICYNDDRRTLEIMKKKLQAVAADKTRVSKRLEVSATDKPCYIEELKEEKKNLRSGKSNNKWLPGSTLEEESVEQRKVNRRLDTTRVAEHLRASNTNKLKYTKELQEKKKNLRSGKSNDKCLPSSTLEDSFDPRKVNPCLETVRVAHLGASATDNAKHTKELQEKKKKFKSNDKCLTGSTLQKESLDPEVNRCLDNTRVAKHLGTNTTDNPGYTEGLKKKKKHLKRRKTNDKCLSDSLEQESFDPRKVNQCLDTTGVAKHLEGSTQEAISKPSFTEEVKERNKNLNNAESVYKTQTLTGIDEDQNGSCNIDDECLSSSTLEENLVVREVECLDDIEDIHEKKNATHKQHCCYFCKKVLYQLPRHWFNVHYREVEVKQILSMHPKNPDRRKKMDQLRKKGDFEYNRQACSENKIVMRESNVKNIKYLPCSSCLGYFSKDNLRHHRKRCCPNKGDRSLQGNSRRLSKYIHDRASQTLRNHIASNMYQDEISNHFLFDEIIILYGNYLCIKYTDSHLKNYIRAQLRLLGRFMMQTKIYDPSIKCCKDLMHPNHIDTIRKSIDTVAGLDNNIGVYEHPTNARTLSTEFKKIIEVVKSECDKKEDDYLMKLTKALSRLYNLELTPYINRICKLSENKYKRIQKTPILPDNNEIEKYLRYLLEKVSFHCANLKRRYSFDDWNKLSQYILVALVVFNRKRPGESQRLELEDFYQKQGVSEKDMEILNEEDKLQADKYVRVAFRGKLGNSTALLIDKHKILPGIEMLIKHRRAAGVHPDNRFLFAYPSTKDKNKTVDAYRCHRQLLEESGIKSASLTFTSLRKQFATQVAKGAPSHEEELRISNYMSHDYKIHKRIYDQSTTLIDITKVSKHLEASAKDKPKYTKEGEENNKNLNNTNLADIDGRQRRQISKSNDKHLPGSTLGDENLDTTKQNLDKFKVRKLLPPEEKTTERNLNKNKNWKRKFTKLDKKKKRKFDENDSDDVYSPSSSSISDSDEIKDELDPEVQQSLGKFRKRRLWTSLEKQTTRQFFETEILGNERVEIGKIRQFKELNKKIMMHRSIAMIKQWIDGEKMKIEKQEEGFKNKRQRFSTPEREILEISMRSHSLDGSEPSLLEMEELISRYEVLKNRTADSLRRKVKYMQQRNSESF